MALGSIASAAKWPGGVGVFFKFIGSPIIALAIGLIFGVILMSSRGKIGDFSKLTNETLKVVGPILFITAAGGVLGKVITEAGFVTFMKDHAEVLAKIGIFFPFLLAAILKTAQGSSTVAITTTAAIMGSFTASDSMMQVMGFSSPMSALLVCMAIGAGAMTVSHANDSYFWVVTNFGEMTVEQGYKSHTMVTLIMGVVDIVFIWLLSLFML